MTASYSLKSNNSLESFRKRIPGKKDTPQDMDGEINPSGDFTHLEGIDTIIKGIVRLLLTCQETYVFDPQFGVGIHKYIWEPCDSITRDEILSDVNSAIAKYEGRAQISTNVTFLSNMKGFRIDMMIKYRGEQRKVHVVINETILRTITTDI